LVARFEEGALQFRDDVAVNPNDTEEAIWAFLCEAQLEGATSAQAKILRVGRDSRPVMRAAYEAFRGSGTIQQVKNKYEISRKSKNDVYHFHS
jgi:hypothetical protein